MIELPVELDKPDTVPPTMPEAGAPDVDDALAEVERSDRAGDAVGVEANRDEIVKQASRLAGLAAQLADLGRPEDAMATSWEAIAIYRQLSAADAEAFLPELVRALTNAGMLASEISWELALAPAEEAVRLYRQLVGADRTAPRDLTKSLSDLMVFLSEMSSCSAAAMSSRYSRSGPQQLMRWTQPR